MKLSSFIKQTTIMGVALLATLMISTLSSCEGVYDDELLPCHRGVSLRFVYDYNMEYANAFPAKVDCVTLYVYDEKGQYVTTLTETGDVLSDEGYRMEVELPEGKYHFVAYGGLADTCEKQRTFAPEEDPEEGSMMNDLKVLMKFSNKQSNRKLHDLFHGELEDVTVAGDTFSERTVYLMKNTNNIRIMLQQLNGDPVLSKDFTFRITDDNTRFARDNSLIPNGTITYTPWAQGQKEVGTLADTDKEVIVAYAELSTSRLMRNNGPRLIINHKDRTDDVVNIPLNEYLLLLKSDLYADMKSQEFLDRESEWSLLFFLDENNHWSKTRIVINDWVVRINDIN